MRLLFFSSMRGEGWGGSEELWAAGAQAALADGHRVCICVFDWEPAAAKLLALRDAGASIVTRPLRVSRWQPLLPRGAWLRALDEFAPEAICLSQGSTYECVGRRSTRPFLGWLESQSAPLVDVLQFNRPRSGLRASTRRRCVRLFERAVCNGFVAQRNIVETAATLGREVPRARVLRNPVNLASTEPLAWPESSERLRLACVGRLHTDAKGQDVLLEALSTAAARDRPWTLSLFGEGRDRGRLETLARFFGIADRVHFRGQTNDIRAVWIEHHLLVLPSRAEGTPLAMVEAMLLGRPCVVTDVGGCTEWVRDGIEGFVASTATPSAVADALARAWEARHRWSEMGLAATARAVSLHDPDPGRTLLELMLSAA